jgi:hypothetical protein
MGEAGEDGKSDHEYPPKSSDIDNLHQTSTIPVARKLNFEGYKNWYTHDDARYAIDVLVGSGSSLEKERRLEVKRRRRSTKDGPARGKDAGPEEVAPFGLHDDGQLQRVRIQSPAILSILSKAMGESWPSAPRAFVRPFKPLVYFHDKMKAALEELIRCKCKGGSEAEKTE